MTVNLMMPARTATENRSSMNRTNRGQDSSTRFLAVHFLDLAAGVLGQQQYPADPGPRAGYML
jgi:hypothetical protein